MRAAKTYEEWKAAAVALDEYLHFEEWKKVDEDPYYDWKLVRKVRRSLKSLREKNDARGCLGVLETCIRPNFAGVESARLYSEVRGRRQLSSQSPNFMDRPFMAPRISSNPTTTSRRRPCDSSGSPLTSPLTRRSASSKARIPTSASPRSAYQAGRPSATVSPPLLRPNPVSFHSPSL